MERRGSARGTHAASWTRRSSVSGRQAASWARSSVSKCFGAVRPRSQDDMTLLRDEVEREEFFERLNALRLRNEEENSDRRLAIALKGLRDDEEDDGEEEDEDLTEGAESSKRGSTRAVEEEREAAIWDGGSSRSRLHSKHNEEFFVQAPNQHHQCVGWGAWRGEEWRQDKIQNNPHEDDGAEDVKTTASTATPTRDHIQEIIRLKLLVANQQATIDDLTLTNRKLLDAKNNNLAMQLKESLEREVAMKEELEELNLQLQGRFRDIVPEREAGEHKQLEVENFYLAMQLKECREREDGMKKELKELNLQLRQQLSDDFPKQGLEQQDQNDLEGRNRHLMRVNMDLRLQLNYLKSSLLNANEKTSDRQGGDGGHGSPPRSIGRNSFRSSENTLSTLPPEAMEAISDLDSV